MSFHLLNLNAKQEQFVASRLENGQGANASDVMRTALRALEREERENEERLTVLREAIEEGLASGQAETGLSDRLIAHLNELEGNHREQEGEWVSTA